MSEDLDSVLVEGVNFVIEKISSKLLHKMESRHYLTSCSWHLLAIVGSMIVGRGFVELGGCCFLEAASLNFKQYIVRGCKKV